MIQKSRKILFILKKIGLYGENGYTTVSSGLYNSAHFINNMLNENGIKSNVVQVVDNNEIDKVVSEYKPDTVIIEALWVVPDKFKILKELHPNVNWLVRVHSELPFIANEGMAIDWLKQYDKLDNVFISSNSKYFKKSMEPILDNKIELLPNYYPIKNFKSRYTKYHCIIDVGLFGAIRPMKNTLTQAIAAITYADKTNKLLFLHINTGQIQQKGDNVLKNIRALFEDSRHKLVEHGWYNHKDFIKLVSKMDIGLQVSLSETYNIVTADFISQGVPVITSKEVDFVNCFNKVESNKNSLSIVKKMKTALRFRIIFNFWNSILLTLNSFNSKHIWLKNKFIR